MKAKSLKEMVVRHHLLSCAARPLVLSLTVLVLPPLLAQEQFENPKSPPPPHERQQPRVERKLEIFDTLDFDVFSNQKWDRLGESHAADVIVTWPDGHETRGIQKHIEDLKALFVWGPDIKIKVHPIRFGSGSWTGVTGVMSGTFSRPMAGPNGTAIQPTGKHFAIGMATIGHWKNGKMDHEWLFWDNQEFLRQIGLGK
jgi:SnoaL-like polyketide cyclase